MGGEFLCCGVVSKARQQDNAGPRCAPPRQSSDIVMAELGQQLQRFNGHLWNKIKAQPQGIIRASLAINARTWTVACARAPSPFARIRGRALRAGGARQGP